ncbi:Tim44 domain-containing protein [Balneatrix alpica]|uniref:Tim44 domain-containing protein n=1 Tax=Balneatrix alpica TaxID=75684 RepID=A0ABV5ZEM1_9GAMM|nr:Tim44-like domain-containing protein [Balneatrix alpica]
MRALVTLFSSLCLLLTLGLQPVEAAKLGGGKSFGKSYSAPAKPTYAPKQASQPTAAPTNTATAAPKKSGLMGGMLGGLLAGGLLGALFFGGAFDGIGLMDILIIAVIAFVLFRLFKRKAAAAQQAQPAYAGAGAAQPYQQPATPEPQSSPAMRAGHFGNGEQGLMAELATDIQTPAWFKKDAFLEEARNHFRQLQRAWDQADYATLADYMTPELFAQLKAEREALAGPQHTDVESVMVDLINYQEVNGMAVVSLQFSGWVREEQQGPTTEFSEVWHLSKPLDNAQGAWQIEGIQQH